MKKLIFGLVLCLGMAVVAQAGIPITVANQSFEVPVFAAERDQSDNWSDRNGDDVWVIDDWYYDVEGHYAGAGWLDSGQLGGFFSPDGSKNVVYVNDGHASGPYQDLGYTIVVGETYAFSMDVQSNGKASGAAISLMFNYHDGADPRVLITGESHDISGQVVHGAWETYSVSFTADAGEDYIGKNLGIEFNNASSSASWHHFDNAQVIPEPATMMLLGLGSLALLKRRRA